jgi:hypothetical protein
VKISLQPHPGRKALPGLSSMRFRRLRVPGASIQLLSTLTGVPLRYISEAERGMRSLSEEHERRIGDALQKLAAEAGRGSLRDGA